MPASVNPGNVAPRPVNSRTEAGVKNVIPADQRT